MKLDKDKYIIVEIIPDHLKLIDRFDYRLNKDKIENIAILKAIDYDNNKFKYVLNINTILTDFKNWCNNYPLILIENSYTLEYLKEMNNVKELVYPYLDMEHSYNVFDEIINKYNLEPSNHLVDLIYEAIIYESDRR